MQIATRLIGTARHILWNGASAVNECCCENYCVDDAFGVTRSCRRLFRRPPPATPSCNCCPQAGADAGLYYNSQRLAADPLCCREFPDGTRSQYDFPQTVTIEISGALSPIAIVNGQYSLQTPASMSDAVYAEFADEFGSAFTSLGRLNNSTYWFAADISPPFTCPALPPCVESFFPSSTQAYIRFSPLSGFLRAEFNGIELPNLRCNGFGQATDCSGSATLVPASASSNVWLNQTHYLCGGTRFSGSSPFLEIFTNFTGGTISLL
jgi:hypothetical protein